MSEYKTLDRLSEKGRKFLGSEYAIIKGAMSWISNPELVAAVSNAGAFGVLAGGSMPPDMLKTAIEKTQGLTDKPFGVNIITMHKEFDRLVEVCIEAKVSHVFFAGGVPSSANVKKAKEGGLKTVCFAPALVMAKRLIQYGADALIIEGSEAGGHIGPVTSMILIQEILHPLKNQDIPVFVAGGVASGAMMASLLLQGAAGCQIGTLFVRGVESPAHPNFKQKYLKSAAREAMPTAQIDERFPVIPVRALENDGTKAFYRMQRDVIREYDEGKIPLNEAKEKIEYFWTGALKRAAIDGDVANGSMMAGQSVGLVYKDENMPVKEIVARLAGEADTALLEYKKSLCG